MKFDNLKPRNTDVTADELRKLQNLMSMEGWPIFVDRILNVWFSDLHLQLENPLASLEETQFARGAIMAIRNVIGYRDTILNTTPTEKGED